MADISVDYTAWSTTESSNPPAGSTVVGTGLDDNLRAIQAGVAQYVSDVADGTASIWTPHRNVLLNGGMSVWQRGTSFTSAGYGADRWYFDDAGANANKVFSRANDTTGAIPGDFPYYARIKRNSSETWTDVIRLGQALETINCAHLRGESVTLSFVALAGGNYSAASSHLVSRIVTGTGVDGSMSGMIGGTWTGYAANDQNNVLTTGWQTFTHTFAIPDATNQIGVQFRFTPSGTAGAEDAYYITGIQLETGSQRTRFDYRHFQHELMLCKRYYEKTFDYGTTPAQAAGDTTGGQIAAIASGTNIIAAWKYAVEKRSSTPTVTRYNPTQSNANWRSLADSGDVSASTTNSGSAGCLFTGATATDQTPYRIHASSSAEL